MQFTAIVQLDGKTATGINVPDHVVEELGAGRRPAVLVTINGYSFPTTLGVMKGVTKIPLNAQHRSASGVAAGDAVDVEIVVDTGPREVALPAELQSALQGEPEAAAFFTSLSTTNQKLFTTWIESAKKAETRERRVTETIDKLRAGKTLR
ncbi:hypothetical protein Kisp01_22160 [Kineosporia sp. NBRC 101677]|uniref:YdeI/OmpD-associated family protein n=1 Tax=Kineosporia sp. NBRC 101677 TaxID=3032197 RepID=UPI0024A51935|nr:YdeI/OmpD-associated family protein [Kineosporia sp. NBRC 101677]GLY15201.1 hypothetical protein Kisp01_22160 [Kineosporia sp. NBRC 101677]